MDEKVDKLMAMFDERERLRTEANDRIAVLLAPTAMTALFELFGLEAHCVEWNAIDLVNESVVFLVNLTYKSTDDMTVFLKYMNSVSKQSSESKSRSLRVGIPVSIAFSDIDTIKEYLMKMVRKLVGESEEDPLLEKYAAYEAPAATEFDVSTLTKEQLTQLMLFQTQAPGEKQ